MNKPKREDYASDVEFQLAYMQWRREQIALRQQAREDD